MTIVMGTCRPGFELVRHAFVENFQRHGEVGASLCVYLGGVPAVDLWAGVANPRNGVPYSDDTCQVVCSTTKGAIAVCANLLIERGELDPERPVTHYWPEFATGGKERLLVRWALSHRAGLIGIDEPIGDNELYDAQAVAARLARQTPVWKPGTRHGYHPLTFGYLAGELVRRVTGIGVGEFFAREIATPLALDFWLGVPADRIDSVAPLLDFPANAPDTLVTAPSQDNEFAMRAFTNPVMTIDRLNDPAFIRGEVPAANGVTNARSLARMYAACIGEVEGVRLLSEQSVERARTPQAEGPDAVLPQYTVYGLGFFLPMPWLPMAGPGSFGHDGLGGSLGFALPERDLAFGYVMNQLMSYMDGDPRTLRILDALGRCVGIAPSESDSE